MGKKPGTAKNRTVAEPSIHEAAPGPHGIVYRGAEITMAEAVVRREAGKDVVVCGEDVKANRIKARSIEDQVGPNIHHDPHLGPDSLPHYQANPRPPDGHCYYERVRAKAKKLT